MDKSSSYGGGPPQSTIASSARRLQSQLPAEPPACVQNAMMRRDKQPFTYTPGGLDLSQIKSPRMAKRISRNAQSEGVANQPKMSPLAQNNNSSSNGQSPVSPAASLGAAAMGMPFQVFPTGPPAPPPPPPPSAARKPVSGPSNGNSAPMPPPPPPPLSSAEQKTPRPPQSNEPPPMGCRPKIAIPANPMANLKKAPRPQPKNDFWIEEYRNERRQQVPDRQNQQPMYNSRQADEEVAKNTQNRTDELTVRNESPKKRSPSPSNLTESYGNGSRLSSIKTPPVYSQSPVPPNLPPPITPTKVSRTPSDQPSTTTVTQSESNQDQSSRPRQTTPSPSTPSSSINGSTTPVTNSTSTNGNGTAPVKPPTPQKPPPQALGSLYIPPAHEVFANSKQTLLNQTSPPWMSSRQNSVKEQPEWVHKEESESSESTASKSHNNNNESSAKPPEPLAAASQSSPQKPVVQQSPIPTTTQPTSRSQTTEAPTPHPPTLSQTHYIQLQAPINKMTIPTVMQQPPPASIPNRGFPPQNPVYVQNQMYSPQPAVSQKERVIPIQIEQSPIKTPAAAPSFAPPPYYSPGPQFNNVQSPITVGYPHSGYSTPTAMFTNPNHFVNQGYNNISYPPTSPQHTIYQQQSQHHPHYPSAPTAQQQQQQQQHAHMMHQQRMQQQTPTQQQPTATSGSVRIIPIKVEGNGDTSTTVRGPLSQTPAIIQSDPRSSKNQQAWNGNVTPNQSRSFRVLQQITDTLDPNEATEASSNASSPKPTAVDADHQQPADSSTDSGTDAQLRRMQLSSEDKALMNRVKTQGTANRANQMFTQSRGNYSESEDDSSAAQQPYIPPSEQRVEEPKKYTGSAIPSRSFKMLQAMTDAPAKKITNEMKEK